MDNDSIKIQITDYDSYQALPSPLDELRNSVAQVPIIRVYGALVFNHNGQKVTHNTLVHVHNYFPYIYMDCDATFLKRCDEGAHIKEVTSYFEFELRESFKRRNKADEDDEVEGIDNHQIGSKRRFIANVTICKAVPFYGFNVGYKLVYKVNLLSPLYKTKLTNLLQSGHFAKEKFTSRRKYSFQVYDGHIPFTSQFLMDFNLFGCNWLLLKGCFFRFPIIATKGASLETYLRPIVNFNNVLNCDKFKRYGKSRLEIDVQTSQILNRQDLIQNNQHHDLRELIKNLQSTDVDSGIHLASLHAIFKDLNFQSSLNGFNYIPQSKAAKLEGHKPTAWPNAPYLEELFDYAIKLNRASGIAKPDTFYERFVKSNNEALTKYPTAFELVDIQKSTNAYLLSGDLHSWTALEQLLEVERVSNTSLTNSAVAELINDSPPTPSPSNDEKSSSESGQAESEHEQDLMQGPQNENNSEIENFVSGDSNTPKQASENSISSQAFDVNDNGILLESTQRRKTSQNYTQIPSSFSKDLMSREAVLEEFVEGISLKINYCDPYYDRDIDLPKKPFIFANQKLTLQVRNDLNLPWLPTQTSKGDVSISELIKKSLRESSDEFQTWHYVVPPPGKQEVMDAFVKEQQELEKKAKKHSQHSTFMHSTNFKYSMNNAIDKRPDEFVGLTNFLLDIHVNTSTNLLPNPERDPITMIVYRFNDANQTFEGSYKTGILINGNSGTFDTLSLNNHDVKIESLDSELAIVNRLLELVNHFDPDVLSGYEVIAGSWGYIIERLRIAYNVNLLPELSRCRFKNGGKFGDRWGYTHTSNIKVNGRHIMNIWRVLRSRLTLTNYSFENCCFHLLHHSFPKYANLCLSRYSKSSDYRLRALFIDFYVSKLLMVDSMIDKQDLITENVEHSRLIGIDFNSNFYRGSQFKVESILARIVRSENLLLNSPSKKNVHDMRALEQIPLIMEPKSGFYKSPLIVLDFQSLYPSIMIAYNYCYSTLVGQLEGFSPKKNNVGFLKHLELDPSILDFLKRTGSYNISPNGYVFVNSMMRKSVLAKMLEEILNARVNMRGFMKAFRKEDFPSLYKVFNARQLALKLIANVTYGYTSASFSGRMPNSDIADAIVATGREILVQSIDKIEASEFGAKVVYGDTDSLFVYLPGKSKAEAFDIGEALAKRITDCFPDPITLKFEKVYHPCVLLSKKRYVGNSFEFRDQVQPKFDAKGIETIRRDGIPFQAKIVEKSLSILFADKNLSRVKYYVLTQFQKIWLGKVLIRDFCFAKEVRYGTYKNEIYLPPGALLAQKKMEVDSRSEPQYRERVPYLVYRDSTKHRLKDRCISPEDFVNSLSSPDPFELDCEYYITKVLIPPLERIFNLMGVDVKEWYKELPKFRTHKRIKQDDILNYNFVQQYSCLNCGGNISKVERICDTCRGDELQMVARNKVRLKALGIQKLEYESICVTCIASSCGKHGAIRTLVDCKNQDCVNYYHRIKAEEEFRLIDTQSKAVLNTINW